MSALTARSGGRRDFFRISDSGFRKSAISFMPFPTHRMRRLRRTERLRNLVRETRLSPESMIYPIFVCPGENVRNEIGSMPGQYHVSIDNAVKLARDAEKAGIGGILLFGIPPEK